MSALDVLYAEAHLSSKWMGIASATLLFHDHAINFTDEVEHFWTGRWTLSRVLYLCIRYLGFMEGVVLILSFCTSLLVGILPGIERCPILTMHAPLVLSPTLCVHLTYAIVAASAIFCQAAVSIRVWYLFAHSPTIRRATIVVFVTSTMASAFLTAILWDYVRLAIPQSSGSEGTRNSVIAWLYAPSLATHSILFALKLYRFVTSPKYLQTDTFLWRFLKEGMMIYAFALGTLLYIIYGLSRTDISGIPLYETAFAGVDLFVALTIVSVCRAMISNKTLAATLNVDPGWLLNHAEMSRVRWHRGATEGEIVVEMDDNC